MCKYDVIGCYVTDSDDWIPAKAYRRLFGWGTSHFDNESIYVGHAVIVTIGKKSHSYVIRHMKNQSGAEKPLVIGVVTKAKSPNLRSLQQKLEAELDKMPAEFATKPCTDYQPVAKP